MSLRKIDFTDSKTFYLFLDGACTDVNEAAWSGTSIGGVLAYLMMDRSGSALVRFFPKR